jgi:hypothetical protein
MRATYPAHLPIIDYIIMDMWKSYVFYVAAPSSQETDRLYRETYRLLLQG